MPPPLLVTFLAGALGPWRVTAIRAVAGAGLPMAGRLAVVDAPVSELSAPAGDGAPVWRLRGTTSHTRYTMRGEADGLAARQEGLGRAGASCAALIPIRKSEAWWALAQDERRAVFEAQSRHIAIGMDYLPGVARRLHHCRELGEAFDFLTWFEYAPAEEAAFDAMLARLRATAEWGYVEREVEVRLVRDARTGC